MKAQKKLTMAKKSLEYFTTNEWKFHSTNVTKLQSVMKESDLKEFQFDARKIVWSDYIENYVLGFRQFVFKQNPSTLDESRKRMEKLKILHQVIKLAGILLMLRFIFKSSKAFKKSRQLL